MNSSPLPTRRVINIHAHLRRGTDVHAKIAEWQASGAIRSCVQCISYLPGIGWDHYCDNPDVEPLLRKYPDHLIGFGALNFTTMTIQPSIVQELRDKGFRGLKCIMPAKPYDDDAYMPFYEEATRLRMPVLFHTGILSYPQCYRGSSLCDYMRPARLQRMARMFPENTFIGAHLGIGWMDEAIILALHNPNLYFDITGGGGSARHGTLIKRALSSFPGADTSNPDQNLAIALFRDKLLFGTDNPTVDAWVNRSLDVLDYFAIPEDVRENFFWKTAAKILQIAV
ncbi:MAG: amidohydrolase family protein [Verrucomicrobiae bacterium]|nr:amidohydrolase family protein [Verrucomicrobiae bacterium]